MRNLKHEKDEHSQADHTIYNDLRHYNYCPTVGLFFQIEKLRNDSADENAERIVAQAQASLETAFLRLSTVTQSISSNVSLQNYLMADDPYNEYQLYRATNDMIHSATLLDSDTVTVCIYDSDQTLLYYSTLASGYRPTAAWLGLSDYLDTLNHSAAFFPLSTPDGKYYLTCCSPIIGSRLDQYFGKTLGYIAVLQNFESFSSVLWNDETGSLSLQNESLSFSYPVDF